ncbi:MAG: hypothetical protein ACJ76H_02895 [Bacteriovoracaceae bacterium]
MLKFTFLLLITSCSYFISKIDAPLIQEDRIERGPLKATYCPLDHKYAVQLIGTNEPSQTAYIDMAREWKLDFFDHFALWSLMQLSVRPDQSSATSRLQVLIQNEDKSFYFDFFSETPEEQYPYFYGVEWILRKFGKKTTLEHYAKMLESSLGKKLKLGKDLEAFLFLHREEIKANPVLQSYYYRGNEILKENETNPFVNYTELIKAYRNVEKNQKIVINTYLTPFVTNRGQSGKCNYDFNLYDNSIFLIDKIIPVANIFGFKKDKNAFMASSSQKIDKVIPLGQSPLFKGESKVRSSAVCVIENDPNRIWAFSNQSRDPGQHLFHLVRYGLPRSQSIPEIDRLIRHSRHLFLSDPVRLIIESGRSRGEQIENLLKLNLPIYNAEKLGNIWAYASIDNTSRFIIDDRNPGAFVCK